jgi:hypothetical protein
MGMTAHAAHMRPPSPELIALVKALARKAARDDDAAAREAAK